MHMHALMLIARYALFLLSRSYVLFSGSEPELDREPLSCPAAGAGGGSWRSQQVSRIRKAPGWRNSWPGCVALKTRKLQSSIPLG